MYSTSHAAVYGQVWVITGDKQETAINIAISCKLILHPDKLMVCNADNYDSAPATMMSTCDGSSCALSL